MTKSKNIKVAVIGCGYWGKNLVRNFAGLDALSAICDSDINHAKKLAAEHGCAAKTFDDILNDKSITGMVIATPAETHAALVLKALKAGKHVFCEKPLAISLKDGKILCAEAETRGLTLMVGHLLQYHPGFLKLKEIVNAGTIGRLQYIYSHRMNFGKVRSEENILWSFAPHDISMILSLTHEEPRSVTAVGSNFLRENVCDVTTTHMEFANGIRAHVFVSWLHPYKEQKLVVIGDKGMLVFNDTLPWNEKLMLYPHRIDWLEGQAVPQKADGQAVPLEEAEPLKLECQHFLDCIAENKTPRTDGNEGLRVLSVLEQAQKALGVPVSKKIHNKEKYFAHESASIDQPAEIGEGTIIWHYTHVLKDAVIGKNCIIGQNCMIGSGVKIGDRCKIQNNVSLYQGVELEDGVFCGPSCVFTNVMNPRAEIERKTQFRPTLVKRGATIGANATVVCGTTLGRYCFIGAGAVVTRDVPDYALMVGNPARRTGWMSQAGIKLGKDLVCPQEGTRYKETKDGRLEEIAVKEKAA